MIFISSNIIKIDNLVFERNIIKEKEWKCMHKSIMQDNNFSNHSKFYISVSSQNKKNWIKITWNMLMKDLNILNNFLDFKIDEYLDNFLWGIFRILREEAWRTLI